MLCSECVSGAKMIIFFSFSPIWNQFRQTLPVEGNLWVPPKEFAQKANCQVGNSLTAALRDVGALHRASACKCDARKMHDVQCDFFSLFGSSLCSSLSVDAWRHTSDSVDGEIISP